MHFRQLRFFVTLCMYENDSENTFKKWSIIDLQYYFSFRRHYSPYNWKFVPFHQPLPISPTPIPCNQFSPLFLRIQLFFLQYSTCKCYHAVFVFLCLTYFTLHCALQIHPYCHKWQDFLLFKGWIIFHYLYLYVYIHISHFLDPFICLQTLRLFPYLDYCFWIMLQWV